MGISQQRTEWSGLNDRSQARAFTLVELLIVIAIVAVLIAILFPALGGARDSARAVSTRNLITTITNASAAFQNDTRRVPGYFPTRDMGDPENASRGMSGMENILLDLAGGAAIVPQGPESIEVGPVAARRIYVNPDLIGISDANNKNYLALDRKLLVNQLSTQGQQIGTVGHTGADGARQLPDVVDYWGQPLLAWTIDDGFADRIQTWQDFARADSGASRALVYWNQNAAFLQATALGRRAQNQAERSLLGTPAGTPPPTNVVRSLAGMLGNPTAPRRDVNSPDTPPQVALRSRAPLVIQSAGSDGVFLGRNDRGGRQFTQGFIDYAINFVRRMPGGVMPNATGVNDGYTDRDGRPTNIDILERFDDIVGTAGN